MTQRYLCIYIWISGNDGLEIRNGGGVFAYLCIRVFLYLYLYLDQ